MIKHANLVICPADNLNYSRVRYYFIVFTLKRASGTYLILNLLGTAFIRAQCLLMKRKTSLSIN